MDCLIGFPIAACVLIPIVAALVGVRRKRHALLWTLLFLCLLVLDQAVLYLPFQTGINDALHLYWNWLGKLLVLAWVIPFLAFGPIGFADAGFKKPAVGTSRRAAAVVAALAIATFVGNWLHWTGEPRVASTIAFQLTMPAIAEEIVFRGALFAVLEKAFGEQTSTNRSWWKSRTVWLTAIAFALIHSWTVARGTFEFSGTAFLLPFVFGVVAGALRKYTRSIAYPMLLHSLADVATAIFP